MSSKVCIVYAFEDSFLYTAYEVVIGLMTFDARTRSGLICAIVYTAEERVNAVIVRLMSSKVCIVYAFEDAFLYTAYEVVIGLMTFDARTRSGLIFAMLTGASQLISSIHRICCGFFEYRFRGF